VSLAAAQAGDERAFGELVAAHQRELTVHCYRMLGSIDDAHEAVQEALLAAWRGISGFQGRSSLRAWLYRIATNVCLRMAERRPARMLSWDVGPSRDPLDDLGTPITEPVFLDPLVVDDAPEAAYGRKESVELAWVAALQHLPPNQRAVLVLRDVLDFSAAETADALDTTTAAVNSALQRAHAQLAERGLTEETVEPDLDLAQRQLLERYVEAFWRKDVDTIVSLLTAEATWDMPPFTSWFRGATNIGWLIGNECPGGACDMPMVATSANGQPAYGLYMRTPQGDFLPFQLQVLELAGDKVRHVTAFFDHSLFEKFGLPGSLPSDYAPAVMR
jgi:RNA polymerase sigma-70 factor (ECF subfamily)